MGANVPFLARQEKEPKEADSRAVLAQRIEYTIAGGNPSSIIGLRSAEKASRPPLENPLRASRFVCAMYSLGLEIVLGSS